jgi:pyruvate formate lyase activating enzyme
MTIFDVQRFSVHDGPGIRTTAFLKGCPLRCLWCQNPEGLEFGLAGPASDKVREVTPAQLAEELLADRVFFETSGGGVTFSGGEPLAQPEAVAETARLLRAQGIHVAVETSLDVPQAWLALVLPEVDLVLADLKMADSADHFRGTGRGNERILANFRFAAEAFAAGRPRVIARTPLIPGYTATEANLEALRAFLAPWRPLVTWELLDFNPLARSKYHALGRSDYPFQQFSTGLPQDVLRRLSAAAQVPYPPSPQESS